MCIRDRANAVTNAIVADVLREFAEYLEAAEDKHTAVRDLVARTWREHNRIIFNGNNYSEEWLVAVSYTHLPLWARPWGRYSCSMRPAPSRMPARAAWKFRPPCR